MIQYINPIVKKNHKVTIDLLSAYGVFQEMISWLQDNIGQYNVSWYYDNAVVYFLRPEDLSMFMLKWSECAENDTTRI